MPKEKPEPIELSIALPEDGTYPPRIVFPGSTLWLHEDSPPVEIRKGVYARNDGGRCTIYQDGNSKEMRINDQSLMGRRVLVDGDFLHAHKFRAIFQVDPVGDFRRSLEANHTDLTTTVELSKKVKKHVIITHEAISLDRGKHFARWDEMMYLGLNYGDGKWSVGIRLGHEIIKKTNRRLHYNYRFRSVKDEGIDDFIRWARYMAPYAISIESFSFREMPDAYQILAYDKIFTPARNHERRLPATPACIFGLSPWWLVIMRTILPLLVGYALIAWMGASLLGLLGIPKGISWVILFGIILFFRRYLLHLMLEIRREYPKYEGLEWPPKDASIDQPFTVHAL